MSGTVNTPSTGAGVVAMLAPMTLLESSSHFAPINIAVGVAVFILLVVLMLIVHAFGSSRPHS
ncbi:hypothetical protein SAMN06266982_10221 [Propioniciclava tarda]|nr:hypothetical protein SAMN06266982_10221 [Propioniciclava tarda]